MDEKDILERNIKRLIHSAGPELHLSDEKKSEILKGLTDAGAFLEVTMKPKPIWRTFIASKITKLVAAAAIIIAVLAAVYKSGSSIDGSSKAWAEAAKRIEQVHTMSAQSRRIFTVVGQEDPAFECDVLKYFSAKDGHMEEQYLDGELVLRTYLLPSEKVLVIVFPDCKQYCILGVDDQVMSLMEQTNPMNPKALVELFGSEQCTRLGAREIDGVKAEGFEVRNLKVFSSPFPKYLFELESIDMQLWVDVNTSLPIEVEAEGILGKGLLTGFQDMIGKETVFNIQCDVELDPAMFELNIPDDYTLMSEGTLDSYDEAKAVQGLKDFGELTGGRYPSRLDMITVIKEGYRAIQGHSKDAHGEKLSEEDRVNMRRIVFNVKSSCLFYSELVRQGKDAAYYGDTVKAEDEDAVLMRWRTSDDEYRLICGNLAAKNVSAVRLAELEKPSCE
jgi:hypothetical protein